MDYIKINNRIEKEICIKTLELLNDQNLLNEYKNSKSCKNAIKKLSNILEKNDIKENIKNKILDDYIFELIPPGTKGVIKGNKFNKIVMEYINNLKLDKTKFTICFEKECDLLKTSEKPDWFILENKTNKIIIGMNQLDLWKGGMQLNRGNKYLINNKLNSNNSKLLCVICNPIKLKNNKSKIFKLFEIGFTYNTLCYIKNLDNIIIDFFK